MMNYSGFLLLFITLLAAPVQAAMPDLKVDATPIDRSNTQRMTSYSDVLERATPAVVSIYTARMVKVMPNRQTLLLEEILRRHYGYQGPSSSGQVTERKIPAGMGSGVIVSGNGYILTSNHVVSNPQSGDADEVVVKLSDGREMPATIVGTDPATDIAVLKIEAEALPHITIADSDELKVGDIVFAIGNPLKVGLTVTQGIVSAVDRSNLELLGKEGYEDFIQTDAPINLGNSGGPLLDADGRLIGINTAIVSQSGGSIGIGFAIPVNIARHVMESLLEQGRVARGFLGIGIRDLDSSIAQASGLLNTHGAFVDHIEPGYPADQGGLKWGDIILKVGEHTIETSRKLRVIISHTMPGTELPITVLREGKELVLNVTLAEQGTPVEPVAEAEPAVEEAEAYQENTVLRGVKLAPLDSQMRERFNIPSDVSGLLVVGVSPESPHAQFLAPGAVLIEVNDQPLSQPEDINAASKKGKVNKLWIYYEGRSALIPFVLK